MSAIPPLADPLAPVIPWIPWIPCTPWAPVEPCVPSADIPHAKEYSFSGESFKIIPLQQDTAGRSTNVYIVDRETGAYNSFTVTNNILKNTTSLLSTNIKR